MDPLIGVPSHPIPNPNPSRFLFPTIPSSSRGVLPSCLPSRNFEAQRAFFGMVDPGFGRGTEFPVPGVRGRPCPAKSQRGRFLLPPFSRVWEAGKPQRARNGPENEREMIPKSVPEPSVGAQPGRSSRSPMEREDIPNPFPPSLAPSTAVPQRNGVGVGIFWDPRSSRRSRCFPSQRIPHSPFHDSAPHPGVSGA